jgi:hypothetical protein
MNPFLAGLDPSKLDPKLLMELSRLIQELPAEQLGKMQVLMHNMKAGFDVSAEMAAFEQGLPSGFRERMVALFAATAGANMAATSAEAHAASPAESLDVHGARLTLLRAVAEGRVSPEEAERLLFPADPA